MTPIRIPIGCYVYAITVDGVSRYVGKGRGRRAWKHLANMRTFLRTGRSPQRPLHLYKKLAGAAQNGSVLSVEIVMDGLSDASAFELERELIAHNRNLLWNVLDGGEGTTSEGMTRVFSDPEFRRRHREACNSPQTKERRSEATKRAWADADSRAKRIAALTAAANKPDVKAKLASKKTSQERRAKQSASLRAYYATDVGRAIKSRIAKQRAADPLYRAHLSERLISFHARKSQ